MSDHPGQRPPNLTQLCNQLFGFHSKRLVFANTEKRNLYDETRMTFKFYVPSQISIVKRW